MTNVPEAGPAKSCGALILGGAHGSIAVARSLGRNGVPVWFMTHDQPITSYSRYVLRAFDWKGPNEAGAAEFLVAFARRHGLEGWLLLPGGDAELRLVAEHREPLSAIFRVQTMSWDVLRILNDKALLYQKASELGIDCPWHGDMADAGGAEARKARFPLVIKPVSREVMNALTLAKAWRVDSEPEFQRRLAEAIDLMGRSGVVVQQHIPGSGLQQLSYAALWDHGREAAYLTARRRHQFPVDFGKSSTFVETLDVPEILAPSRRLLEALNYHGLVEVEYKRDPRDGLCKLLDANTRIWAWLGLGEAAGVDFAYLSWKLARGEPILPASAQAGIKWVHPVRNAMAVLQQAWRDGRLESASLNTMFARAASATFARDDLMPWLADLPVALPRVARRISWPSSCAWLYPPAHAKRGEGGA